MKKIIVTAATMLMVGAGFVSAPAGATSATDCFPGQSVDANGCYPTPGCSVTDLSASLSATQAELSRVSAVSQRRAEKIRKQARLIRHLRAELRH